MSELWREKTFSEQGRTYW